MLFKNWYILEAKELKPCPQNRMLVPLMGSIQNFQRVSLSFLYGSTPPPPPPPRRDVTIDLVIQSSDRWL